MKIRPGTPDDVPTLMRIEREAATRFIAVGLPGAVALPCSSRKMTQASRSFHFTVKTCISTNSMSLQRMVAAVSAVRC